MGGLALKLVDRAKKLHIMMILALIISKLLRLQAQMSVASIGKSNATYLVAGNSLELVLPKLLTRVATGQEKILGYGNNKQDRMAMPSDRTIRMFTRCEPRASETERVWVGSSLLKIQSSFLRDLEDKRFQLDYLQYSNLLYDNSFFFMILKHVL